MEAVSTKAEVCVVTQPMQQKERHSFRATDKTYKHVPLFGPRCASYYASTGVRKELSSNTPSEQNPPFRYCGLDMMYQRTFVCATLLSEKRYNAHHVG